MIYTRYNQYKEESVSVRDQAEGTEKTKKGQTEARGSGIKRNKIKELREIISKAKAEEAEGKNPTEAKESDPTK
jgi:hypothetical protein